MGSSISLYCSRAIPRSPDAVQGALRRVWEHCVRELSWLKLRGLFGDRVDGSWDPWIEEEAEEQLPFCIVAEGPLGFSVYVYECVAEVSSLERFGRVANAESPLRHALRRVLCAVAAEIGTGSLVAVAASGFGDTDEASADAREGASFERVCECLHVASGSPARTWGELEQGEKNWYLGDASYGEDWWMKLSPKQAIYHEILTRTLAYVRTATRYPCWMAMYRSAYLETSLIRNIPQLLLDPEVGTQDARFLNNEAKRYCRSATAWSPIYSEQVERLKSLFTIVAQTHGSELTWSGPKQG